MAMARPTGGISTYPWAAPPSRVVRTEEALGLFRAEKGALQDLVTSSCTSGKKGTGGGCRLLACAPRNQSSSLERSGEGGVLQCSPTLSAARESIAVSSGSESGNATLPDGGSTAESSSPEPSSSPDAAIDVLSSAGAPNEMLGPTLSEDPTSSSGNTRWCSRWCTGGLRGPRRRTRRGSSHCDPQITLTMSRSSPPKPGDLYLLVWQGGRTQHCDGHVPAMRT